MTQPSPSSQPSGEGDGKHCSPLTHVHGGRNLANRIGWRLGRLSWGSDIRAGLLKAERVARPPGSKTGGSGVLGRRHSTCKGRET